MCSEQDVLASLIPHRGDARKYCLGDFSDSGTPDPIPNSAVKTVSANGSAVFRARVGRRQDNIFFFKKIHF
jgi:hypothetical protein